MDFDHDHLDDHNAAETVGTKLGNVEHGVGTIRPGGARCSHQCVLEVDPNILATWNPTDSPREFDVMVLVSRFATTGGTGGQHTEFFLLTGVVTRLSS